MNIIFVKPFIDYDSFDGPFEIKEGDSGILINEATGRIEFNDRADYPVQIEGVPAGCYVPSRVDI